MPGTNPEPPSPPSRTALFLGLIVILVAVFVANVVLGSATLSLRDLWSVVADSPDADPIARQIALDFRLPRALTALLAGAALAVSGLLMQTVFRNPLADPFVLGVNSGASLGVAIALLFLAPGGVTITQDLALSGHALVALASSLGAAAVLAGILVLAQRLDVMSLLILGLMVSYAVGAVVSILMFFSMAERIQSFVSWSFGSFANVTWNQMRIFGPLIAVAALLCPLLSKSLDALLLGERAADSLGVRVRPARIATLAIASVMAGAVTGFCGPIGFLGIAAPHLCRYLFRAADHRALVPASLLVGAIIALASDLVAKAPGFETALPLNAVTALVGAPIIIAALMQQRNLKKLFGK